MTQYDSQFFHNSQSYLAVAVYSTKYYPNTPGTCAGLNQKLSVSDSTEFENEHWLRGWN